jgi:hypothetical protein
VFDGFKDTGASGSFRFFSRTGTPLIDRDGIPQILRELDGFVDTTCVQLYPSSPLFSCFFNGGVESFRRPHSLNQ